MPSSTSSENSVLSGPHLPLPLGTRRCRRLRVGAVSLSIEVRRISQGYMVYGRNGSGKTRFAASGPKCLILDFNEEGTRSARGTGAKVLPISTWPDVDLAYWYLKRGDHSYETVALDTITGMAEICMNRVLRESYDRDPNKDPKSPRRQDWGTMGQMMKEQLLRFRNLPMATPMIAKTMKCLLRSGSSFRTAFHTRQGIR